MTTPFHEELTRRMPGARQFMLEHARLLERRLFAIRFDGAPAEEIVSIIRAYRNGDGGLGHALEPDVRCSESQPLFAEMGLVSLNDAEYSDPELALELCHYLESVSDEQGLVPLLTPLALASPMARHWSGLPQLPAPGINPTAGICGLLYAQGIDHPWMQQAARVCCQMLEDDPPRDAHALLCATRLIDNLPNLDHTEALRDRIGPMIMEASCFLPKPPVTTYGLTPLHFAPTPDSPWRRFFPDEAVRSHLMDLLCRQADDGGWPIFWPTPGAAVNEWRGRWTLESLLTLSAYAESGMV